MDKLIWKIRYAIEYRKRTKLKWSICWDSGHVMLFDCLDGDTSEMQPKEAVWHELQCLMD